MKLSNLKPAKGSTKTGKRVGRGQGSGYGGTSTRGHKGQKSRSGYSKKIGFEGGQMPLQRRVPKRGFNNIFRIHYQPVNVERLQKLSDDKKLDKGVINPAVLFKNGLISKAAAPYKILGNGDLTAKLSVEAYAFSESAKGKIESTGGTIKMIDG